MKEELTTMMLSITVEDKVWLMQRAAQERTTVAAMIRGWIADKRAEGDSPADEKKSV